MLNYSRLLHNLHHHFAALMKHLGGEGALATSHSKRPQDQRSETGSHPEPLRIPPLHVLDAEMLEMLLRGHSDLLADWESSFQTYQIPTCVCMQPDKKAWRGSKYFTAVLLRVPRCR